MWQKEPVFPRHENQRLDSTNISRRFNFTIVVNDVAKITPSRSTLVKRIKYKAMALSRPGPSILSSARHFSPDSNSKRQSLALSSFRRWNWWDGKTNFGPNWITFPLDSTTGWSFHNGMWQWGMAMGALNQHVRPCLCKLAAVENDAWCHANRLRWTRIELPQQTAAKIRSHSKSVNGRWRNTVPFTLSWQHANRANDRPVCLFS